MPPKTVAYTHYLHFPCGTIYYKKDHIPTNPRKVKTSAVKKSAPHIRWKWLFTKAVQLLLTLCYPPFGKGSKPLSLIILQTVALLLRIPICFKAPAILPAPQFIFDEAISHTILRTYSFVCFAKLGFGLFAVYFFAISLLYQRRIVSGVKKTRIF